MSAGTSEPSLAVPTSVSDLAQSLLPLTSSQRSILRVLLSGGAK